MKCFEILLKIFHKLYFLFFYKTRTEFCGYVEIKDQKANDFLAEQIVNGQPLMVSKFGTVELSALLQYLLNNKKKYSFEDFFNYVTMKIPCLWWNEGIDKLCTNAGFFPNDINLLSSFYNENISAASQIDILGSYIYAEKYFAKHLSNAKKINLDGYYAPFLWNNPWTKKLKGKSVLVIHPFAEDIESQYKKRVLLWDDPDILPEFTLITYKAVQSMLNTKTEFNSWFEALEKMKKDISNIDFDIALVGCGAYGMPLSAYIKSMGKQAIHMAGWTQVLFGIIGKRWEDLPQVSQFIKESWIHPSSKNVPQNAKQVEQGCYW